MIDKYYNEINIMVG